MRIVITPCIDSLLYAPLYIGIIDLWGRGGRGSFQSFKKGPMDLRVDNVDYTLELSEATNGDQRVVDELVEASKEKKKGLWIGVCDPITVLNHNRPLSKEETNGGEPYLVIPGVFIDRMNLSVFARAPVGGNKRARKEIILERIIEKLNGPKVNPKGIFGEMDEHNTLGCAYWVAGETTRFLARHYLDIKETKLDEDVVESSAKVAEKLPPTNGLDPERDLGVLFERLKAREIDFAITHEPWILDPAGLGKVEVFCRECFPAVQFPFSCFATLAGANEHQCKAIRMLLESVYAAINFIHHNPVEACKKLGDWRKIFGNYGIPAGLEVAEVVSRAIHHFLKIGCYSDTMWPEPIAWDFALSMDPTWTRESEGDVDWQPGAWDVLDQTLFDVRMDSDPPDKIMMPFRARTTVECKQFREKVWNACKSLAGHNLHAPPIKGDNGD